MSVLHQVELPKHLDAGTPSAGLTIRRRLEQLVHPHNVAPDV
jgi:hypothetical protein